MLNPNCSEIVAKLPVQSIQEAREFLERNSNIKTIKYNSYFDLLPLSEDEIKYNVVDPDNPNTIDFYRGSTMQILEGDYDSGDGIYVVAGEHGQHQLYDTIHKLSKEKNLVFYGFDGGAGFDEMYLKWLDNAGPGSVEDLQEKIRKIVKKFFENNQFHRDLTNMSEIIRTVASPYEAEEIQQKHVKKIMKKILNKSTEIQEEIYTYVRELREEDEHDTYATQSDEEMYEDIIDNLKKGVSNALILCVQNKEAKEIFFNNEKQEVKK